MFTKKFWYDVLERVISTAAGSLLAVLSVSTMMWGQKLQVVGVAALASFLKCLVATQVGADNTAAIMGQGPDTDKGHADVITVLIATACAIIVYLVMAKVFKV